MQLKTYNFKVKQGMLWWMNFNYNQTNHKKKLVWTSYIQHATQCRYAVHALSKIYNIKYCVQFFSASVRCESYAGYIKLTVIITKLISQQLTWHGLQTHTFDCTMLIILTNILHVLSKMCNVKKLCTLYRFLSASVLRESNAVVVPNEL